VKYPLFFILSFIVLFFGCKIDEPSNESTLPSNVINKIVIDKQGVKWIATDKGLVSFDGSDWKTYNSISILSGQKTTDIAFDAMSNQLQLWTAGLEGVSNNIIANKNLTNIISYQQTLNGLLSNNVLAVGTDNNNAKFFGTPNGLSILKNNLWTTYDGKWGTKSVDNFLTLKPITAIASAKNGWNYVATNGGGVSRFKFTDAVTGATKYFRPWASGLKSDVIYTVVIVNDTCQWYGTDKGVAYHTSEFTKADWTSYSVADGMVSDSVYAIAQDAQGNTWFGTQRGVSKLNNYVWTNFTTHNGLISNKVNTVAVDIDGSVWFGTDNGISQLKEGVWKSYSVK